MTEAERSQLQIMHYHDSVALRVQNSRQLFQIVIRKFGRDKTKLQVAKMKKKLAEGGSLAEALKEKAKFLES